VELKQLMALKDENVVHLAKLKTLRSLAIVECEQVTDRGVRAVVEKHGPTLTTLDVTG
jgi:hypothetical protein